MKGRRSVFRPTPIPIDVLPLSVLFHGFVTERTDGLKTEVKEVNLQYYALLREERGLSTERRTTTASTAGDLYRELRAEYAFKLDLEALKVAINGEFGRFEDTISDGDEIVFIPPVAGG